MASCPDSGENEMRVVLIGKTGTGKSATGNTILGTDVFQSNTSSKSVTKVCKRGTSQRFGRRLQVVDTPGMYDTEMSKQDIIKELAMCVTVCAPGPHAFVLVISAGRFTEEEYNSVQHYRDIFGADMSDYLIVLFTRRDDLDYDKKTIEDFIGQSPNLLSILEDSKNRCLTFNNRGTQAEKDNDVQNLLGIIDKMISDNGGKFYTNKMYQEAERVMKEKEEKLKRKHDEDLKKKIDEMKKHHDIQVQQLEQKHAEDRKKLQEKCQSESTSAQNFLLSMREEMRKMKEHHEKSLQELKDSKVNFREVACQEAENRGGFFQDYLLPVVCFTAKEVVPFLLSAACEVLKNVHVKVIVLPLP